MDEDLKYGQLLKIANKDEIVKYVHDLSKELNIEDTHGVRGNELELIALVRNCKFLYDKSMPEFKDSIKKEATWSAISTVMHSPVKEVQQRWRNLRETYNRLKRDDCTKPWEYYDDMKFLDDFIKQRTSYPPNHFAEDPQFNPDSRDENIPANILKFISCIKSRPILYNSRHPNYKDMVQRNEAWIEVARSMGTSVQACETKWKLFREKYARERKAKISGNDLGRKPWNYFDTLSFLDKIVKSRNHSMRAAFPTLENSSSPLTVMEEVPKQPELRDEAVNTIEIQQVEFIDASNVSSPDDRLNIDKEWRPPVSLNQRQDEDELFGQTIAAELRRLPSGKKKFKIKSDIYKILYENEDS